MAESEDEEGEGASFSLPCLCRVLRAVPPPAPPHPYSPSRDATSRPPSHPPPPPNPPDDSEGSAAVEASEGDEEDGEGEGGAGDEEDGSEGEEDGSEGEEEGAGGAGAGGVDEAAGQLARLASFVRAPSGPRRRRASAFGLPKAPAWLKLVAMHGIVALPTYRGKPRIVFPKGLEDLGPRLLRLYHRWLLPKGAGADEPVHERDIILATEGWAPYVADASIFTYHDIFNNKPTYQLYQALLFSVAARYPRLPHLDLVQLARYACFDVAPADGGDLSEEFSGLLNTLKR